MLPAASKAGKEAANVHPQPQGRAWRHFSSIGTENDFLKSGFLCVCGWQCLVGFMCLAGGGPLSEGAELRNAWHCWFSTWKTHSIIPWPCWEHHPALGMAGPWAGVGSLGSDTTREMLRWDLGHRRCSNLQPQPPFQGTNEN